MPTGLRVWIRGDEPERSRLLESFDALDAEARDEFFHLFDLLGRGGIDADCERVTLDGRYEASSRKLTGTRWHVGFVLDHSADRYVVLTLTRRRPDRAQLFAEALTALQLVNPIREDH